MLMRANKEYNVLLEHEVRFKEDEQFGETDNQAFAFKMKITSWLKNPEGENKYRGLSRSKQNFSVKTINQIKHIEGINLR